MSGHFAHCSYFKILHNSQNIRTYYMLNLRIRCIYCTGRLDKVVKVDREQVFRKIKINGQQHRVWLSKRIYYKLITKPTCIWRVVIAWTCILLKMIYRFGCSGEDFWVLSSNDSKFGELLKLLLLTVFQNKNLRSLFSMMISKLRSWFVFTAHAIVDLIYYQTHQITRETSSYLIDVLLLLYW